MRFDHIFYKFIKQAVFPSDEDGGFLVFRFLKLILQTFDFPEAKFSVDGQAPARVGLYGQNGGAAKITRVRR